MVSCIIAVLTYVVWLNGKNTTVFSMKKPVFSCSLATCPRVKSLTHSVRYSKAAMICLTNSWKWTSCVCPGKIWWISCSMPWLPCIITILIRIIQMSIKPCAKGSTLWASCLPLPSMPICQRYTTTTVRVWSSIIRVRIFRQLRIFSPCCAWMENLRKKKLISSIYCSSSTRITAVVPTLPLPTSLFPLPIQICIQLWLLLLLPLRGRVTAVPTSKYRSWWNGSSMPSVFMHLMPKWKMSSIKFYIKSSRTTAASSTALVTPYIPFPIPVQRLCVISVVS